MNRPPMPMQRGAITLVVDGNAYYLSDDNKLMSGPLMAASEKDELGSVLEHDAEEYTEVDWADFPGTSAEKAQLTRILEALILLVRP